MCEPSPPPSSEGAEGLVWRTGHPAGHPARPTSLDLRRNHAPRQEYQAFSEPSTSRGSTSRSTHQLPPVPPTTRGPDRFLVYLRSLRALNSDDYRRVRLTKPSLGWLWTPRTKKPPSRASPSTFVTFFPAHHLYCYQQRSTATATNATYFQKEDQKTRVVQRHWKQNIAHWPHCITTIVARIGDAQPPPRDIMEAYQTNVFTQPATNIKPQCARRPPMKDVWQLTTPENIRAARPFLAVSPGRDSLTARQLIAIPPAVRTRIYNLILWCKKLPEHFAISRTVFISKKPRAKLPGDFRPISVFSVLTRLVHKVLA